LLEIEKIFNKIELNTHYGEMKIEGFSNGVEYITLNSNYSDFTLVFDEEKLYNLEIICNDKTRINYPDNLLTKKESPVEIEDEEMIKIECKLGKLVNTSIPIKIQTKSGTIDLKSKKNNL